LINFFSLIDYLETSHLIIIMTSALSNSLLQSSTIPNENLYWNGNCFKQNDCLNLLNQPLLLTKIFKLIEFILITIKVIIYERKNCRKWLQILSLKLFATGNCPVVDVADANDLLRQPCRKRYDIFLWRALSPDVITSENFYDRPLFLS